MIWSSFAPNTSAKILEWINGQRSFGEVLQLYSKTYSIDHAKSWLHCHTFVRDALKAGIISPEPIERAAYLGRSHYLKPERLKEFWIHLMQTCNLTCSHCLVSSGPKGEKGMDSEFYKRAIDETCELGVERYYFTGGEPFVRTDIFELIQTVTETKKKELIVLTNATLLNESRIAELSKLSRKKLKFQVSLDGVSENTNDAIREASVIHKEHLADDPFKYLTGGGDMEHSYFFSTKEHGREVPLPSRDKKAANGKEGSFKAQDPYYSLYVSMIKSIMQDLAVSKQAALNLKSGFNAPTVLHAMGEDAVTCSEEAQGWLASGKLPEVRLLHSNCVLSFDVEKPYKAVQKFYGKASEKPQEELCCPVKYDDSAIKHIPQEVIDRFYGCGSPISMAQVKPGETTLDLGSGAGIDCFISAKKVGSTGKVIGVDMTAQMLEVANRCKPTVAQNLGYDVVEFKKGYLENIPVPDHSVNLVTSNCVINLSPDKKKVFAEIWRILKDTGRLVVADIVSDQPVPLSLQAHQDLWGECISGSLSEAEFLSQLEKAGFYGLSLLKKSFWKEVEGVKFYSITVRGFKFEKKAGCKFIGQKAIYLGPYKATIDEEGHLFPRGETIEVCTDTAAKLKAQPYSEQFVILEPLSGLKISFTAAPAVDQNCGPACCC